MDLYVLVLRVLHVAGGVFWAGASWALAGFVSPSVEAAGASGRQVMGEIMGKRNLSSYFGVAAMVSVISGLLLYWRSSQGLSVAWMTTGPGISLTIGALAGIGSFVVGITSNGPLSAKLADLGKQVAESEGPPSPELMAEVERVQAALGRAGVRVSIMLAIAILGMASAEALF